MKTLTLALLFSASLAAQDLPSKPTVKVDLVSDVTGKHVEMALPVAHRTADRSWWLATVLSFALTEADLENSMHAKNSLPPGETVELNPLLGKHPGRGRYYSFDMSLFGLATYMSYRQKRIDDAATAFGAKVSWRDHWWLYPLANGVSHAVGIIGTMKSTGY